MKISELDTPVLLVDAEALGRNIARMQEMTAAAGVTYRPHSKTHKSSVIARMQLEAGAVGVCCAKLGEAEVMGAAGIGNILITTPVVGDSKIGRLLHLANQVPVAVVADNAANVDALGNMAQTAGRPLDVLVEVDVGQGRCGVQTPDEAAALAKRIQDNAWLRFGGIQGYQGKIQMVTDAAEREAETGAGLDRLDAFVAAVEAAGVPVALKTGGGTGTSPFDMARDTLTELQTGSYVFMDSRYGGVGWPGANAPPFEQSLHILTAVVSTPTADRAICDAGLKSASSDHGPPAVEDRDGHVFEYGGDEHGILRAADGSAVSWHVGDKLKLVPSHCDTTVNLYDRYIVVRGDEVVDVWPIEGRGKTQ